MSESPTLGSNTVLPKAERRGDAVVAVTSKQQRYDPVTSLGEGSMGLVDLVADNDIGRLVAVKRLKNTKDPSQVLRFAREVRSLGRLEHPGIVPVHDVGRTEDGDYFLVMKHLEGETLEAIIRRLRAGDPATHAAFPIQERVRLCESVLQVMEYAHDRGVIHRDLKPGNIMIGAHGEVTIVDWGLAKHLDDELGPDLAPHDDSKPPGLRDAEDQGGFATLADSLIGTPLYMSVEQAAGDVASIGTASDVYCMGVMFYELLSLEHYLADLTELPEVLLAIAERDPKLAYWVDSPHQPRVPIELAYWLQKAMQKDRERRFASATEMRAELQRIRGGKFDVVCPTTFSRRVFRFGMDTANQHPVLVLLAMLGLTLLAGLGAIRTIVG